MMICALLVNPFPCQKKDVKDVKVFMHDFKLLIGRLLIIIVWVFHQFNRGITFFRHNNKPKDIHGSFHVWWFSLTKSHWMLPISFFLSFLFLSQVQTFFPQTVLLMTTSVSLFFFWKCRELK